MPIVIEFGELNGNSGSVDVDVEMFLRERQLWCRTINQG